MELQHQLDKPELDQNRKTVTCNMTTNWSIHFWWKIKKKKKDVFYVH